MDVIVNLLCVSLYCVCIPDAKWRPCTLPLEREQSISALLQTNWRKFEYRRRKLQNLSNFLEQKERLAMSLQLCSLDEVSGTAQNVFLHFVNTWSVNNNFIWKIQSPLHWDGNVPKVYMFKVFISSTDSQTNWIRGLVAVDWVEKHIFGCSIRGRREANSRAGNEKKRQIMAKKKMSEATYKNKYWGRSL